MIFSSEIYWSYRRLDFGINILDEPDEHISVKEIEVSVPTLKRRIGDDLSEDWTQIKFCFPREKAVRRSPLVKRNRRKSRNKLKCLK